MRISSHVLTMTEQNDTKKLGPHGIVEQVHLLGLLVLSLSQVKSQDTGSCASCYLQPNAWLMDTRPCDWRYGWPKVFFRVVTVVCNCCNIQTAQSKPRGLFFLVRVEHGA